LSQQRDYLEQQFSTSKAKQKEPVAEVDQTEVRELKDKVNKLEARSEEANRTSERLQTEKRTLETENQDLKSKLSKAKEDVQVLYTNLQECINNFQSYKKQLEAKIEREVFLETEIKRLKDDVDIAEGRTAVVAQEARELREAQESSTRRLEELRAKIVSSDDLAYVYTVIKESFLGREKLLVGSSDDGATAAGRGHCPAVRKSQ
jgi:chromosome segregation ATPase